MKHLSPSRTRQVYPRAPTLPIVAPGVLFVAHADQGDTSTPRAPWALIENAVSWRVRTVSQRRRGRRAVSTVGVQLRVREIARRHGRMHRPLGGRRSTAQVSRLPREGGHPRDHPSAVARPDAPEVGASCTDLVPAPRGADALRVSSSPPPVEGCARPRVSRETRGVAGATGVPQVRAQCGNPVLQTGHHSEHPAIPALGPAGPDAFPPMPARAP